MKKGSFLNPTAANPKATAGGPAETRVVLKLIVFLVAVITIAPGTSLGQQAKLVRCEDQLIMYQKDRITPGLAQEALGWYCPDPNARVMPIPKRQPSAPGSGAAPSTPGGGGTRQQMQMQMMQGILGALIYSAFAPPAQDHQSREQQELQMWQIQEKQKQAALEAWEKIQIAEAARLAAVEAQKRKQGGDLLARMGSTGGGGLQPLNWDTPRAEFKPLGTGRFDTSNLTQLQRLLCASYFSNLAQKGKDPEEAAFMNRQADAVAAGGMTEVECVFPAMPDASVLRKQALKLQRLTEMIETVEIKVKELQDIEMTLAEVKKQRQEAETKLREAEAKVAEITKRPGNVAKPEETAQEDDILFQQALAELNAAKEQLVNAEQAMQKYEEMRNRNIDDINNMEQQAIREFAIK